MGNTQQNYFLFANKKMRKVFTCGLTTYWPFVADRISRECSNSLVIDSMVLAGLGSGDAETSTSAEG